MNLPWNQAMHVPLVDAPRALVLHPQPSTRGVTRASSGLVVEDEVECRPCRLQALYHADGVLLVSCGLRVHTSDAFVLRWTRLRITPTTKDVEMVSGFPRSITESRHITGLVDLSPDSSLEHEQADDFWFSVPEAHFAPYLVAGRIEPRGLFWDFHSADGTLPAGASQLLFVARTPNNVSTGFEINACISVTAVSGSTNERREVFLDLPPYVQAVEPPAR
ncbi:hypothetical protein [Streptomyces sp. BE133]|uniref:hypothetical protein n=1 Tax=Streptomyces sp. BE133 TaxID=3002523 RepID=UPI002E76C664|nr:hypothetical protein [Streptomyces sp. BE133]MEE1810140.1 hypothetical protein [Streptomyces sp. BE133]